LTLVNRTIYARGSVSFIEDTTVRHKREIHFIKCVEGVLHRLQ
jgi:hypothetical protein